MSKTLKETVREDGLRIITKKLGFTKRLNLSVSARVGLAYDGDDWEGRFHFWEHMAFKGTKTKSMSELKKYLGRFLNSNAFTDYTHTTYILSGASAKKEELSDVLFDMYVNPALPAEEIEKEKGVVLLEAANWKQEDQQFAGGELNKLLWRKNPLRRLGVGTEEGMRKINQVSLFADHAEWYRASNTIVIGVGDVDHDWLSAKACEFFPISGISPAHPSWEDEYTLPLVNNKALFSRSEREKAVVLFGCKIPKLTKRERHAVNLMSEMVGGGFDSMLFEEVRDKRGLAYSTGSGIDFNPLSNSFVLMAQIDPKNIDFVEKLLKEIAVSYELEPDRFQRTKTSAIENSAIALESPDAWESLLWRKIIKDEFSVASLENYIGKSIKIISDITFEEVVALRDKLITHERLACVLVKPS